MTTTTTTAKNRKTTTVTKTKASAIISTLEPVLVSFNFLDKFYNAKVPWKVLSYAPKLYNLVEQHLSALKNEETFPYEHLLKISDGYASREVRFDKKASFLTEFFPVNRVVNLEMTPENKLLERYNSLCIGHEEVSTEDYDYNNFYVEYPWNLFDLYSPKKHIFYLIGIDYNNIMGEFITQAKQRGYYVTILTNLCILGNKSNFLQYKSKGAFLTKGYVPNLETENNINNN